MGLPQPRVNLATEPLGHMKNNVPVPALCARCSGGCGLNHTKSVGFAPASAPVPTPATDTRYGAQHPVELRMPMLLSDSANDAHAAAGAALSGVTLVCGLGPDVELDSRNRLADAPQLRRRIAAYRRWRQGPGDIMVRLHLEDIPYGAAEFCIDKLGVETIELTWGPGAACTSGPTRLRSLDRAWELHQRGQVIIPDPTDPAVQAAYRCGAITEFARPARRGFVDQAGFMAAVAHLRQGGARRVALKSAAYPQREMAAIIKWASDARLDLVAIDAAGDFCMPSLIRDLCGPSAASGHWTPGIVITGVPAAAQQIFQALALGAPYVKAVGVTSLPTPPAISPDAPQVAPGLDGYAELREMLGSRIRNLPLGVLAVYSHLQKLRTELQRLMAAAHTYSLAALDREAVTAMPNDPAAVAAPCIQALNISRN